MSDKRPLSPSLGENVAALQAQFHNSADLVIRPIHVAEHKAAVVSIEGMVDRHAVADAIILPLVQLQVQYELPNDLFAYIKQHVLGIVDILEARDIQTLAELIVSGFVAVLVDGVDMAALGGMQAFMIRSISEPSTETTLRGSREGFTEAVRINMSMIRRRLKTSQLMFETLTVGKSSQTSVCLCYLRDRVSSSLLQDVRGRIQECPLETVLESGYLQPFLEGEYDAPFAGVGTTERPDTLCGKMAEGRIGVLVDGTPFALVVPYLFAENFQSMDDYTAQPLYAGFIRVIKYIAFFVSLFLPALYVAIGTHHAEMLPSVLLLSFINSDRSTPFSLTTEALLIHFVFEIMREAGLRFPKSVGHAVSIVGALVIGESAVRAGLVGAPMIIVVALTSISAFVIPSLYGNIVTLRFVFIVLGGTLGIYGVLLGALLLLCRVCAVNIDSIPYTAPITPFSLKAMRDVFVRMGWPLLGRHRFLVQNVVGSDIKEGEKGE